MQGVILNIIKVKDEDLVVTLITKKRLKTLYRFYGSRHSTINIGYKIDFVPIYSPKSTLPMLREVVHLGFSWQMDYKKFYIWQQFIKLLYKHLKDVNELDSFYFELLEEATKKIAFQNPKRVLIESYLKLLEFEGRLHLDFRCFVCDGECKERSVIKRGYLLACKNCLKGFSLENEKIYELFTSKSTLFFDDKEVEKLWDILSEGL